MHTGTQMQAEGPIEILLKNIAKEQAAQRESIERLAQEMRATSGQLFARLARRDIEVAELKRDAYNLALVVQGKDGDGGLVADVERLIAKVNVALGVGIACGAVGTFVGWCIDKMATMMMRH